MNIYLIEATVYAGYDANHGFVVMAASENVARNMVSKKAGDEGPEVWTSLNKSSCKKVGDGPGPSRIVLTDFHAG